MHLPRVMSRSRCATGSRTAPVGRTSDAGRGDRGRQLRWLTDLKNCKQMATRKSAMICHKYLDSQEALRTMFVPR